MTNEQINKINTAIAEACGWTDISHYTQAVDGWYGYEPENGPHSKIPNFCNDLNVMREAMLTLTNKQGFGFLWHLNDMGFVGGDWELLTLDSQVLAEAFLRTFGKWEE
jgi:hypothetical protein